MAPATKLKNEIFFSVSRAKYFSLLPQIFDKSGKAYIISGEELFSCILLDYVAHEITKKFWKNSHSMNMTAMFSFGGQKHTSVFHPWNDAFSGTEKKIFD